MEMYQIGPYLFQPPQKPFLGFSGPYGFQTRANRSRLQVLVGHRELLDLVTFAPQQVEFEIHNYVFAAAGAILVVCLQNFHRLYKFRSLTTEDRSSLPVPPYDPAAKRETPASPERMKE